MTSSSGGQRPLRVPFRQRFEVRVNRNMREGVQAERAARQSEDHDMDLKKGFRSPPPEEDEDYDEAVDEEMHDRKDRPPRFSTIFGAAPPAPTQASAPVQYIERRSKRRSGVFMPMPLFVLFMVILFFESTILFAYTILGIYNNAGPRLFGLASTQNCLTNTQPLVNISPSFVLPQAPQPVQVNPWLGGSDAGMMPDTVKASTDTVSVTSISTSTASVTSVSISTTSITSVSTDTQSITTTTSVSASPPSTSTTSSTSPTTSSTSTTSSSTTSDTSTTTSTSSSSDSGSAGATVWVTQNDSPLVTVTSIAIASPTP